jgi:acyl-CoA synthetase (AMP-forming)/AMP-acid ligase II
MPIKTLPELLRRAASAAPLMGIDYVQDDGSVEHQSYSELLDQAIKTGSGLRAMGLMPGDKAIIATEDNHATINLLWACFMAGIIPTILQPPVSYSDHNPILIKLMNVYIQLGNPCIFIDSHHKASDHHFGEKLIHFDDIPDGIDELKFYPGQNDLAFIQFSSGSTGEPKGVMLTHRNLAKNIEAIIIGLDLTPIDHTGNWMPLYHDMGLIGYHLTPIYVPCRQSHIHTVDFIKNPSLWLDLMSNSKITVTGCPNFGQALVLRHLKRKTETHNWDFSSMKALLNGAEPISVKIMDDFTEALKKYNFREEAMMPVYGMAEATLAISFTPLMKPSVITAFDVEELDFKQRAIKINQPTTGHAFRILSSIGVALKYFEIRIVDDLDSELPDGNVGHIQIKGGSVTQGYFNNAEATKSMFCGDWLRTGDIGFFFEGYLYISGRFKDIIFINGKNYYANDLENLGCTLEGITYGKIVFGGISDKKNGREKVLAFIAGIPDAKANEALHDLRVLLRKTLGVQIDEMIPVRSNEIPKTSSGKVQRYKLIQRYLQGEFTERKIK